MKNQRERSIGRKLCHIFMRKKRDVLSIYHNIKRAEEKSQQKKKKYGRRKKKTEVAISKDNKLNGSNF